MDMEICPNHFDPVMREQIIRMYQALEDMENAGLQRKYPTMDPRMAKRVEAGGPREFDYSQQPSEQGNLFPMEMRRQNQLENISNAPKEGLRIGLEEQGNLFPQEPVTMQQLEPRTGPRRMNRIGMESDHGAFDEPAFARVEGGGYKASMNVRRGVENITKDYTSPLPGIQIREGMQNGMDAADTLGIDGVVKVRMGMKRNGDYTIEVYDNGKGMDDATLGDKLFEAFSTGKEGEEGATGGKGIGSASYIYGGKSFKITTIAVDGTDGLKYKIVTSGTPEQFITGKSETFSRVRVHPETQTGTTMEVVLKDEHNIDDARSMVDRIVSNTRNRPSSIIVDRTGSSYGTPLEDIKPDGTYVLEHKFASSKNDKVVGDFTTVNRNSEVKVLIPKFDETISRGQIEIHYLNNGMYQFSETMHLPKMADGVPDRVLIDIHPLVDDQNELYPFINTREDIKRDIRDEVTKYVKDNISSPGINRRKK